MDVTARERIASTGRLRVPGWMAKLHGSIFADARNATARSRITVEPPNEEVPKITRNFASRVPRVGEAPRDEAFDMVEADDALEELSDSSGDESHGRESIRRDHSAQVRGEDGDGTARGDLASTPESPRLESRLPESVPKDDGGTTPSEGAVTPRSESAAPRGPSLLRRVGRSLQNKVRRVTSPTHAVQRYRSHLLAEAAREESAGAGREEEVERARRDLVKRAQALGHCGLPRLRNLQRTVAALSLQRLRIQVHRSEAAASALRRRAAVASELADSLAASSGAQSQKSTPTLTPTPSPSPGQGEKRRWRPGLVLSRLRSDDAPPSGPEGGDGPWERVAPLLQLSSREVVAADPRVATLDRALADSDAVLERLGADLQRRMRRPEPEDAMPSTMQVLTRADVVWRKRRDRSTMARLVNAERSWAEARAAAMDRRARRRQRRRHRTVGGSGECCGCCSCRAAAPSGETGGAAEAGAACEPSSQADGGPSASVSASASSGEATPPAPAALECILFPDVHANRLRRAGRTGRVAAGRRRAPCAREVLARRRRITPAFSDAWGEEGPPDLAVLFEARVFNLRTHIGRLLHEWVRQMLWVAREGEAVAEGGEEGEEGGLAGPATPSNALPPPGTLVAFLRYVADLIAAECRLAREDSRRVPLLLLLESALFTRVQPLIWRYNADALARKDAVWWRCQVWARTALSPHSLGVEAHMAGPEPWNGRPLFPRASLALAAMVVAPTPMRQLRQLMNAVRQLMREGTHRAARAHAKAPTFDAESLFPCLVHALICADCYHIHAALCAIEMVALPFADIVAAQADVAADAALRSSGADLDAGKRREWVELGESASEASYYTTALTAAVAWVMERGVEAGVDQGGGDAGGAIALSDADADGSGDAYSSHAVLNLPTASPTDEAAERQATQDMAAWVDRQRTMDHLVQSLSI